MWLWQTLSSIIAGDSRRLGHILTARYVSTPFLRLRLCLLGGLFCATHLDQLRCESATLWLAQNKACPSSNCWATDTVHKCWTHDVRPPRWQCSCEATKFPSGRKPAFRKHIGAELVARAEKVVQHASARTSMHRHATPRNDLQQYALACEGLLRFAAHAKACNGIHRYATPCNNM